MIIFPSIDIYNGRCVRLLHGDKNSLTDYGEPLEKAINYSNKGAEYLHIVDLSAAFSPEDSGNFELIKKIINSVNMPVQIGGGVRTIQDIDYRINILGAERVVIGTAAYTDPDLLKRAADKYPHKIAAGLDAKDNKLAIKGWTLTTDKDIFDISKDLKNIGIDTILFTDISRDGALTGVNYTACEELTKVSKIDVIASGGVKDIEDIQQLKERNIYGAILGRSLYEHTIDLQQAITLSK